jgi:uncharacterized membrane protein
VAGWAANPAEDPSTAFSQVGGINDHDQLVGATDSGAYLWQPGEMTALPPLAGGGPAADINNRGQIVGGENATNPDNTNPHAVLWTR